MRRGTLAALLGAAALAVPGVATAHVERPSYWPDPAPDTSVDPPTGGEVPKIRSLASALKDDPVGETRIVCQKGSIKRIKRSVRRGKRSGYDIRPTDHRRLSKRMGKRMMKLNRKLRKRCQFDEIQAAVTASGNNDRVVIMPGIYTEPTSRSKPTFDASCDKYETTSDRNEPGALSYAYQFNCPNDQNLIAVLGRRPGSGEDPDPPRWDRHGIPNLGGCIRCNLQIEGSGVSADDVVIEAGNVKAKRGGPNGTGSKKDVGIRADRADGLVLRNVTVRHAKEHGIYVLESDGFVFDRFKAFYNGLYGVLSFVEDHGLMQNCEAVGHGDSAIYPGAAVESGEQRPAGTPYRYNQEVQRCDLHHNLAGYSGTDGNAVRVHHNNVYDNALGLQTDVVTAAGHPGFPSDSALFENNNIFSNNFNPYEERAPAETVEASFPFPVGTGMWIAGGNNHTLRGNYIYDNWRRGTMLFAVPDALVCGNDPLVTGGNKQAGCDEKRTSTSHRNRYHGNFMGLSTDGRIFRDGKLATASATRVLPNGTDFWWDDFPGNRANCWFSNNSAPGKEITTSPSPLPDCDNGQNPNSSVGKGNPENEGELSQCLVSYASGQYDPAVCPWFVTPPQPGSSAARQARSGEAARRRRQREDFLDFCRDAGSTPTCEPFARFLR